MFIQAADIQFPEVEKWATNVVTLLQIIGGAITVVCICIVALTVLTSFQNEHKRAGAYTAMVGIAIGVSMLLLSDKIATVFKALVDFTAK